MYYIDFDNTLYETGKLTKDVLYDFSKIISNSKNLDLNEVLEILKNSFNSTVDNFESFACNLATKYGLKESIFKSHLKKIILENGKKYVFKDAIDFLEKLNKKKVEICILTYVAQKKNIEQQALKLLGSGILPYVTHVFNTTKYKFELLLDYENGIFIDDSPRDLEGLYKAGARNLIRIKKPNNEKRTSKNLSLPIEIPTFESFEEIEI